MERRKLGAAIALACLGTIGGVTALPILAVGIGSASPTSCGLAGEVADDGTPRILGPSTLTVADLRIWWDNTGRGQPARLRIAIADLIALYLSEGDAEGVRGDIAFAQAVLETGYFSNSDTAINNFAGIGHYDGAPVRLAVPEPDHRRAGADPAAQEVRARQPRPVREPRRRAERGSVSHDLGRAGRHLGYDHELLERAQHHLRVDAQPRRNGSRRGSLSSPRWGGLVLRPVSWPSLATTGSPSSGAGTTSTRSG
ncbi:MAG: glucosaminidase domain-containing protein [Acidimicrobiia bacterium]|nr:glucosaminidase domain-containing protein [Acidimicrobiia bacterium]